MVDLVGWVSVGVTAAKEYWAARRARKEPAPVAQIFYDPLVPPVKSFDISAHSVGAFYHLRVKNTSKTARLMNCEGVLEEVVPVGGIDLQLSKPEILKWANEQQYKPLQIEPEQIRKLDFFYLHEGNPWMHFFFEPPFIPAGVTRAFPPGTYRAAVRVRHDAGSSLEWFEIMHSGVWDAVRVTPLKVTK